MNERGKSFVLTGHLLARRQQLNAEGYRCRTVEEKDLEAIDRLLIEQHFDIGFENTLLYYKQSPQTWQLVEDSKGEVVSFASCNVMSNGLGFAYQIIVKDELQGIGLTALFDVPRQGLININNETVHSIRRYIHQNWGFKMVGYFGVPRISPDTCPIEGVTVKPVTASNVEEVIAYDSNLLPTIDRRQFIREWVLPKSPALGLGFAAYQNDSICGYGMLRQFSRYWGIEPLYADNDACAEALLNAAGRALDFRSFLFLTTPAQKSTVMRWVHSVGLIPTETEMRHYDDKAKEFGRQLNIDKVYCVHEYWPL